MPASPKVSRRHARGGASRGDSPPKLALRASSGQLRAKRLLLCGCLLMVGAAAMGGFFRSKQEDAPPTLASLAGAPPASQQPFHQGLLNGDTPAATGQAAAASATFIASPASKASSSTPEKVATTAAAQTRVFHHKYDHTYEKVWATVDLLQYASLIQEDIKLLWTELADARQKVSGVPLPLDLFTQFESEFSLALTMLAINVSNVCEIGMGSGRSAVTWLESNEWVHVWSFGRPPTEVGTNGGSTGAAQVTLEAKEADEESIKFLQQRYNHGEYGERFHWIPANATLDADEFDRLRTLHAIPPCQIAVVYGSGMTLRPVRRAVERLRDELVGVKELMTSGWHFVMMDGFDCTRNVPNYGSDQIGGGASVDQAGSSDGSVTVTPPPPPSGNRRVHKDYCDAPEEDYMHDQEQVGEGEEEEAGEEENEEAAAAAATEAEGEAASATATAAEGRRGYASLASGIQRLWKELSPDYGQMDNGTIVPYQCHVNSENGLKTMPGWCLGTFKRAHRTEQGEWTHTKNAADDDSSFPWLSSDSYLSIGDKLESTNKEFYLAIQEDGNLVIYRVIHSDVTEKDEPTPVWSSRTSGEIRSYFLVLRADSNLAVYPGLDGTVEGDAIWATKSSAVPNTQDFYLVMQDDGKLAIYRGKDPSQDGGLVRRMRPRYVSSGRRRAAERRRRISELSAAAVSNASSAAGTTAAVVSTWYDVVPILEEVGEEEDEKQETVSDQQSGATAVEGEASETREDVATSRWRSL